MANQFKIYYVELPDDYDNNVFEYMFNWDIYDSFVVVAQSESDARHIHPGTELKITIDDQYELGDPWIKFEHINSLVVTQIGITSETYTESTVICASFNAG